MKVLQQTAGFIIFAAALEGVWMLLRVDVLEDLNLFADVRYWPWFAGAVFLHALLAIMTTRIARPLVINASVFGILALALAIGLLVPWWSGGDGLAVGMFQFLNGYWVLVVAGWWLFLRIVSGCFEFGQARPR